MSKLRVIDGDNVTSIVAGSREIRQLESEISRKHERTNRDLVVYAYHFVRLGNLLLAQKYLNQLDQDYFDAGVYRDLSGALLAWSMLQTTPALRDTGCGVASEYFVVLKRALETFEDVNFQIKPAFYRFKRQFNEFTTLAGTR